MKSSVSDEKLLSDYTNLQERVAEQQQIIDSQNEMLDEAQVLMQQLRVLFVFWLLKNRRNAKNGTKKSSE